MADTSGSHDHTAMTQAQFESERRVIALRILAKTDQFLEWDLKFNNHLSDLAAVLVEQLRANPRLLESRGDVEELVKELNVRSSQGPGVSGGDIVGAGVWDDIWGVIKDLLVGEKDFIKEIIKFVLGM